MTYLTRAVAFAPGSIGNVGPGLDVLGAALTGPGDAVMAEWIDAPGIRIKHSGHPELPLEPTRHSSGVAAMAVIRSATALGLTAPANGIALTVTKGLPLSAGQGGSAASAVAGASAVNALSGRQLDNIAPSLVGGVAIIRSLDPIDIVSLPVPDGLRVVLAHPNQRLRTSDARAVLPIDVPRAVALHQMAQVAAIVAAFHSGDLRLLGRAIDDRIAEPVRAPLLPGFVAAKRAALAAGALGASISGAGPSAFAFCDGDASAAAVALAMRAAYAADGIESTVRVERIDMVGVRLEHFRAETS